MNSNGPGNGQSFLAAYENNGANALLTAQRLSGTTGTAQDSGQYSKCGGPPTKPPGDKNPPPKPKPKPGNEQPPPPPKGAQIPHIPGID